MNFQCTGYCSFGSLEPLLPFVGARFVPLCLPERAINMPIVQPQPNFMREAVPDLIVNSMLCVPLQQGMKELVETITFAARV